MCTAGDQGLCMRPCDTLWCYCQGELGAQRANSASEKQVRQSSEGATRGRGVKQAFAFAFAFDEHCKN